MSTRNKLSFVFTIVSLALLYPGLTLPIFSIDIHSDLQSSLANVGMNVLNKTTSIIDTIKDLHQQNNNLVAVLILLFSIVVPIIKGILIFTTIVISNYRVKENIIKTLQNIGKWSMADVFVVAIFLAYLSTRFQPNHSNHEVNFLGMKFKFQMEVLVQSQLGPGFYYFLGYCLISLLAIQIYEIKKYKV